ncbi:xanthine dehydrogenase YagR molybdenum-binding subunit [Granulicella aggregans]|uniref:Xanthine dehydrogenase YagR molybdenum-binding subunit n=1 Tax=Granulicella aggregans TaxID=474949 RepID=A0A7W8E5B5_9BACT|nr:xanthine dehydrogenase family protein molybdopterin-binding subunit [Granulicella aggregans]MBB5059913.1 xanthine dehydrogenase YagR molybdenum-binding subunit [Granulicella aggregans]
MMADTAPTPAKQLDHRYEGIAKVTGKAKYAAEFSQPFPKANLAYAYIVQSTIPNGTIASVDRYAADLAPGVIAILTPFNAPKLAQGPPQPPARRNLSLLQDKDVHYNGQPIAVVVAKSLNEAKAAARLLTIKYVTKPAQVSFRERPGDARWPKNPGKEPAGNHRGDVQAGFAKSAVVIEQTYVTPIQHHNPMEPHATIAWWEGEKLNVYDATQYISGVKMSLAKTLDIPVDYVRVINPVVGGGFGSKGSMWSHVPLCAMAAKATGRPVKLVLEREQMFGPVGGRPSTVNKIKLGASADGKLLAMQHDVIMNASAMEDFTEHSAGPTKNLYMSESNSVTEKVVEVNLGVSTFMRAPGEAPGTAALEIAMDELAEKLKMDPVQFRLVNYAENDPSHDRPWTDKHLRECYSQAAERFGWSKRSATPGSVTEGNALIGYGMATATYPANRSAAQAVVRMLPGGRMFVGSGTQDLGTGTYTIMAQQAASGLGIDPSLVEVKLGDSTLPKAPVSGGSQSSASVLPAIQDATTQLKLKLADLAIADIASPLHGLKTLDIEIKEGKLFNKNNPSQADSLADLIARNGNKPVEAMGSAEPSESKDSMTSTSWGAVFAEVAVDKDTHMVKVRRVVGTYDIGTLLNKKTGLNQLVGGIVWSISFALHEEAHIDPVYGRVVNESLAEYHVPVNADIGAIDVTVLNIPDIKFNPIGSRGIGEIGITGAAAAVANAIYNATGKRVREYPITPDKIMAARGLA